VSAPVPTRIRHGRLPDAGELFTLQRAAFLAEAQRYRDPLLPPLRDTLEDVLAVLRDPAVTVLVAVMSSDCEQGHRGRIVGSARFAAVGTTGRVGRIIVAPDLQGRGLGSALLQAVQSEAQAAGMRGLELFTGKASSQSLALYRRHGYVDAEAATDDRGVTLQVLRKAL
jgi:GNAT superfamily N-acetyltransferase